ncbi:MAG TPA: rhodanese-like domain-containing protein [Thermoanaerobaculia bacterium]|nr:rhodanese-like domain-containing protein [Thermoanaerobaculia bacterium]
MAEVLEIDPSQVEAMLRGDDPPVVLDVREPWETEICRVEGSQLIPMGSLPQRLQELPRGRTIAVLCHAGARSYYVAEWLLAQGYEAVSVAGGINAWPGMRRY